MADELRTLFLGIARTAAASSWLVACVTEPHYDADEEPRDAIPRADSSVVMHDSGVVVHDSGAVRHDSGAGGHDSGVVVHDAGVVAPADGGVQPADAGPRDASVLVDGAPGWQDATVMPDAAWELVPCPTGVAEPSGGLKTEAKLDYLGVHSDYDLFSNAPRPTLPDGGFATARSYVERVRVGATCAGASSPAACEQEITTVKSGGPICSTNDCRFALVGVGATYTRIDMREALISRLGSIDTAAEAVLVAAFDGRLVCPGLRTDPRAIGTEVRARNGGGYELRITREDCGAPLYQELLAIAPDGASMQLSKITLNQSTCAIGRRAPGLCESATERSDSAAGAFLARAAQLEAGSIYAFFQLIRELSAHGAPEALRTLALDAMLDEVAHAYDVAQLARAFGADVVAPQVRETPMRSLLELALDNAQEGCVRETFGALLATYQAEAAEAPQVRSAMARIAEDETRHATLSWQLMAWIAPRLTAHERDAVAAARHEARATLEQEFDFGLSEAERRALGLPTPALWKQLLAQMDVVLVG